jgi:hypothetical protein
MVAATDQSVAAGAQVVAPVGAEVAGWSASSAIGRMDLSSTDRMVPTGGQYRPPYRI